MGAPQILASGIAALSATDAPILRSISNVYQLDAVYTDLFGENGVSQLCGPAAVANALRSARVPVAADLRTLFANCRTDRNNGTKLYHLAACAQNAIVEGGNSNARTFVSGIHANDARYKIALGPQDVVKYAIGSYAVVILFGLYSPEPTPFTEKWSYTRKGGHYVTLAGYDEKDFRTAYVSNPLVNYDIAIPGMPAVSRVQFVPLDDETFLPPAGRRGLWETKAIVAGYTTILENMIVTSVD